ncbi:MAG: helix-turn-helix transcriptional regulator [Parvularculaceae bacterium]
MVIIRLDVMMAARKMKSKDLAAALGVTEANLSRLKTGAMKGVKFETLDRLCTILDCQPGDLLEHVKDEDA